MDEQKCWACKYYVDDYQCSGHCYYYPPKVISKIGTANFDIGTLRSVPDSERPLVGPNSFCSKFEKNEKEDIKQKTMTMDERYNKLTRRNVDPTTYVSPKKHYAKKAMEGFDTHIFQKGSREMREK